jgi:hypothetical protein
VPTVDSGGVCCWVTGFPVSREDCCRIGTVNSVSVSVALEPCALDHTLVSLGPYDVDALLSTTASSVADGVAQPPGSSNAPPFHRATNAGACTRRVGIALALSGGRRTMWMGMQDALNVHPIHGACKSPQCSGAGQRMRDFCSLQLNENCPAKRNLGDRYRPLGPCARLRAHEVRVA